jgi:hypothetical protein
MKKFIAILFASMITSCGDQAEQKKDVLGREFSGSSYVISCPSGWQTHNNIMGCDSILINPEFGNDDGFAENITIVLETIPSGISIEEYIKATSESLENAMGAKIVSLSERVLGPHQAQVLRYEMTMGNRNFDNDAIIITKDSSAYILTLSTMVGDSRAEYHETLMDVAATFRLE